MFLVFYIYFFSYFAINVVVVNGPFFYFSRNVILTPPLPPPSTKLDKQVTKLDKQVTKRLTDLSNIINSMSEILFYPF